MRRLWSWVVGIVWVALLPQAARAAGNGRISFDCGSTEWINPDGSDERTLLQGHAAGWSPDGIRIAYVRFHGFGNILVRNVTLPEGTEATIGDGLDVFDPVAWSWDDRLAVVVSPTGSMSTPGHAGVPTYIDVMNVDGSNRHRLIPDAVYFPATSFVWSRPAWSPDGRWLAVGGTDNNDLSLGARLFLFPIANGAVSGPPVVLTTGATGTVDDAPAWSPTGNAIAFLRQTAPFALATVFRVDFTIVNGTVTVSGEQVVDPVGFLSRGLAWSPDGTLLAEGHSGIDVVDASGNGVRQHVVNLDCNDPVGWQPLDTPVGAPVSVTPRDHTTGTTPVRLRFDEVTAAGVTRLETSTQGPPLPANFALAGVNYEIHTTAVYAGSIEVCIDTTGLPTSPPLQLMHYVAGGTGWVTIATSSTGNQICGSVTSLSPFAIVRPASAPPVINAPADVSAEATGPAGAAVTYTVTVFDPTDPSPTLTCSPASGSVFALGTTTVACTATNAGGSQASASFPVHVVDTTPPSLTVPADITVIATSASGAVVSYAATATDLVSGSVAPVCSPASGSTFPIGATTVACTATDAAGNGATGAFAVRVTAVADPLTGVVALVQQLTTGSARQQLLDILDRVRRDLAQGHVPDACRDLVVFAARVVWLRLHHVVSASTAAQLVDGARQVAQAIHCPGGCI